MSMNHNDDRSNYQSDWRDILVKSNYTYFKINGYIQNTGYYLTNKCNDYTIMITWGANNQNYYQRFINMTGLLIIDDEDYFPIISNVQSIFTVFYKCSFTILNLTIKMYY